jgi:hypothetical protein
LSRNPTLATRGPVDRARKSSGAGAVVEDLASWLRTRPGVEAVAVEAFTVEGPTAN